jgi:hypothetical protein
MHHRAAVSKKLSITIDYIHKNCVEQGLVKDPVDWKYCSAMNYEKDDSVLK